MSSNDHLYRFTAAAGAAAAGIVLTTSLALATGSSGGEGGEGGEGGVHTSGFGDSATIEINGTIPSTCTFTTLPNVTSVGQMVTDAVTPFGSLGFTCNMATSSSVSLTVKSLNGALKRVGGSETVAYQVAWNIQGATDVFATIPTSPAPFTLLSGLSGVQQLGVYKVKVTGPTAGKPAGNYKDIVTYTIAP